MSERERGRGFCKTHFWSKKTFGNLFVTVEWCVEDAWKVPNGCMRERKRVGVHEFVCRDSEREITERVCVCVR